MSRAFRPCHLECEHNKQGTQKLNSAINLHLYQSRQPGVAIGGTSPWRITTSHSAPSSNQVDHAFLHQSCRKVWQTRTDTPAVVYHYHTRYYIPLGRELCVSWGDVSGGQLSYAKKPQHGLNVKRQHTGWGRTDRQATKEGLRNTAWARRDGNYCQRSQSSDRVETSKGCQRAQRRASTAMLVLKGWPMKTWAHCWMG